MKLLYVIRAYPYPAHSGDLVSPAGMIETMSADPELDLTVYCAGGLPEPPLWDEKVRWIQGAKKNRHWQDLISTLSSYPRAALRAISSADKQNITKLLSVGSFSAIVANDGCTAPILDVLKYLQAPRPKLIYLSHNVDADIRPRIARSVRNPFKRALQMFDAQKYRNMELRLIASSNGITASSEEDLAWYSLARPDLRIALLKPAYSGHRVETRKIDATMPRLVVLVGSFYWNAKQRNLEEILAAYQAYMQTSHRGQGFNLRIAGQMPNELLIRLRNDFPSVEFTGSFEDVSTVLIDARLALVLEKLGGGFKLKMLDYVFHRVPILGFPDAMAGSGLRPEEDFIAAENFDSAILTAASCINDLDRLNRLQDSAFDRMIDSFNWKDRVAVLKTLIHDAK